MKTKSKYVEPIVEALKNADTPLSLTGIAATLGVKGAYKLYPAIVKLVAEGVVERIELSPKVVLYRLKKKD